MKDKIKPSLLVGIIVCILVSVTSGVYMRDLKQSSNKALPQADTEALEEDEKSEKIEKAVKEDVAQEEKVVNEDEKKEKAQSEMGYEDSFYIKEIDEELFQRIKGKSYKDDCTVPVNDLSYIHILYVGFDGEDHEGEMVVNKIIAQDMIDIFKKLYENRYEIEKVRLVDEYDADDESSMRDNNSSGFNFRFISHTTKVSKHGLGLAVDINPLYNPYVKEVDGVEIIAPRNAADYVDRSGDFPHKIDENDLCYKLFTEHGFEWGGHWNSSKDYQHFEYNK